MKFYKRKLNKKVCWSILKFKMTVMEKDSRLICFEERGNDARA